MLSVMEDDGLTTGAIQRLLNKENVHKPVLQISDLKAIRNDSAERCRIVLFDGADCLTYAMLGAHLTNTASDNHIDKYAVVRLEKYMWYTVRESSRDILVVLGLTVIRKGTDVGRTLWRPSISIFSTPSTAPVAASFESSSSGGIIPIAQLTPSYPGRTIRVRVTYKTAVRGWSNSRGPGKLFSLHLLDESGEISATAFNQDCDRLYDAIQVNKVYDISNYIVKPPKDPSYSIFEHEYELLFTSETVVYPCPDDPPNIPKLKLKSVPISNVPYVTENSVFDVIGICSWTGDVRTVKKRSTNEDLKKRDILLVDESRTDVSLPLWGDQAEKFHGAGNPVIAVKGVRVSRYNGDISLSMLFSGALHVNPDIPEAQALSNWYKENVSSPTRSLSAHSSELLDHGEPNWKCLAQVEKEHLGGKGTPKYYSVMGCLSVVRVENAMYKACASESCKNKKVLDLEDGNYLCEKCGRETNEFKWWPLITSNYDFEEALWDATFKRFIFRLRVAKEAYNNEIILKTTVVDVAPVSCNIEARRLLQRIQELSARIAAATH
ncbi:replication protein A 70 kDa DNA-binding subunit isoform X3 [Rhipicephalus microplus]|uniref:replication protein A 70 kDa DNA-binding subunit isoform X3 n=1 Tax=Rhipicephalus microplus TaxID=6941 RepID=UPI003F6BC186